MRKLFYLVIVMGVLAFSSTAIAENHSFNTDDMNKGLYSNNIYKDIGCGYKSTVFGSIILNGTFRIQKGISPPVGESRLHRNQRQLTDTYNRYNCREVNNLQICDYTWKRGLFDNEAKGLAEADTNNDKRITVDEAKKYWMKNK